MCAPIAYLCASIGIHWTIGEAAARKKPGYTFRWGRRRAGPPITVWQRSAGGLGMKRGKAKGAVGIIGLGIMGGAFAQNLAAADWRVVGYDIDPKRCRALARDGVEIAKDAQALAAEVPSI